MSPVEAAGPDALRSGSQERGALLHLPPRCSTVHLPILSGGARSSVLPGHTQPHSSSHRTRSEETSSPTARLIAPRTQHTGDLACPTAPHARYRATACSARPAPYRPSPLPASPPLGAAQDRPLPAPASDTLGPRTPPEAQNFDPLDTPSLPALSKLTLLQGDTKGTKGSSPSSLLSYLFDETPYFFTRILLCPFVSSQRMHPANRCLKQWSSKYLLSDHYVLGIVGYEMNG